jgi:hypothetical protein
MFHHGKTHKLPIGKAEDRDGNYTVRNVKAPNGHDILIGTTHFAQSNRFAQDVFGLVAEDVLRGVSIGFDPPADESEIDVLGASPTLDRPAMHFKSWKLLEYSHTPIGVNRDALTVKVEKALEGSLKMHPMLLKALRPLSNPRKTVVAVHNPAAPAHAKARCAVMKPVAKPKKKPVKKGYEASIDETVGKPASVPNCPECNGSSIPLERNTPYGYECQDCGGRHGLADGFESKGWPQFRSRGVKAIVKAFDPQQFIRFAPVGKAMDDDELDDPTDPNNTEPYDDSGVGAVDADLPPEDDAAPVDDAVPMDDEGPTPAVKSMYDASQGLLDLCSAVEAGMKKSEHGKARKYAAKLCADLRKAAAEAKTFGDKVAAELDKLPSESGEDEPEPEVDGEAEPDADDIEADEDGAIVTKNYTPRRWTFSELAGQAPAATVTPPSDAALARQVKALERQLKAKDKAIADRDSALNDLTDTLETVARRNR